MESLDEFFRQTREATRRRPADVIAADEAEPMGDDDFDTALWLSLCGFAESESGPGFSSSPDSVRAYFATRLIELEIGNGGFSQAVYNARDYFDAAVVGYELLGQPDSVALIREAAEKDGDEAALEELDDRVDGPPWMGVPWADAVRVAYVRAHRDDFRL